MKILLIEDETELRKDMKSFLQDCGYMVEFAVDFSEGMRKANEYDYDCILADVGLPGGSGLEIIRELKRYKPDAAIIIISANESLDDKISGLEIGADDYLAKPFHLAELNARLKALIRRKDFGGSNELVFGELKVNVTKRAVLIKYTELQLTVKEFDLLLYLISNKNRVVSKGAVAEHLWGDHADRMDSYDFIYSHIKNLRKKLIDAGGRDYISNVYGIGYSFKFEI